MRSLLLIASLFATQANGECLSFVQDGGDTIEFAQGEVWPEIVYRNDAGESSGFGQHRMCLNDVSVMVYITSGHHGAERITVIPDNRAFYAEPPKQDVPDGEASITQILLPVF